MLSKCKCSSQQRAIGVVVLCGAVMLALVALAFAPLGASPGECGASPDAIGEWLARNP